MTLYNTADTGKNTGHGNLSEQEKELLAFLSVPRSRQEITAYLGIGTVSYAMQAYINPMIEEGLVKYTIPEKPRSRKQRFVRSSV